jgi:hypothetical protein
MMMMSLLLQFLLWHMPRHPGGSTAALRLEPCSDFSGNDLKQ